MVSNPLNKSTNFPKVYKFWSSESSSLSMISPVVCSVDFLAQKQNCFSNSKLCSLRCTYNLLHMTLYTFLKFLFNF